MPERAHETDAGWDLRTPKAFYLAHHQSITIDTGVHVDIPKGYYGRIASKSGLNANYGIISEGVVDSGYTGSIRVTLHNLDNFSRRFDVGDKITQLIIEQIPDVTMIEGEMPTDTERGENGFGSTGK